jgi:hypothetical protein
MMEHWNNVFNPIFHHSIIPIYKVIKDGLPGNFEEKIHKERERLCPRLEYGLTD